MSDLARKTVETAELCLEEVLNRGGFKRSATPMWLFDTHTFAFLAVNDAAVQYYGFSRKEFLSMTILDIRPTEGVIPLIRAELLEGRHNSDRQRSTHCMKDGSLIEVEITSREIKFNGRSAEIVIVDGVTGNPTRGT